MSVEFIAGAAAAFVLGFAALGAYLGTKRARR